MTITDLSSLVRGRKDRGWLPERNDAVESTRERVRRALRGRATCRCRAASPCDGRTPRTADRIGRFGATFVQGPSSSERRACRPSSVVSVSVCWPVVADAYPLPFCHHDLPYVLLFKRELASGFTATGSRTESICGGVPRVRYIARTRRMSAVNGETRPGCCFRAIPPPSRLRSAIVAASMVTSTMGWRISGRTANRVSEPGSHCPGIIGDA